jgi:TolB-like protein
VILFEMLTGTVPFQEDTPRDTALARLRRRPPDPCSINPALPRWLGDVVLRCLEREPGDRCGSVDALLDEIDAGIAEEEERPTATVDLGAGFRRGRRFVWRPLKWAAPVVLVVAGVALATPVIWQALRPATETPAPLLEDGVVRIAVVEFERITDDAVTRMVAAGLSEALRSKLAQRQNVRVVDVPGLSENGADAQLRNLGVEQVCAGRVGRLGDEVRILVRITSVPGRERWMTVDRSLRWEETWEGIDALAVTIAESYFARLEAEGGS